jgi:hypothetical protein
MGTTLDVVLIAGPEAFVAHVGDSRTYLVRDGRSSQITTDHTVAEVLVIEGKLTIEEAQVSPLRTILVNAIGVSADVGVEMAHVTLKRGDRLLLCSDGLHDYFPVEEEIAQKLSADTPGDALKEMVELAKTRGGHDNITGVAVQVTEVIEAVPAQVDGEHTHPVDVTGGNPFASDEPTETAFIEPMPALVKVTTTSRTPAQLKSTQPMRVLEGEDDDEATADTIPPADKPKPVATAGTGAKAGGAKAAGAKADAKAADLGSEETIDIKADDAALDAKLDGPASPAADDSADAAKPSDALPAEIETADTGQIRIPKDQDAG